MSIWQENPILFRAARQDRALGDWQSAGLRLGYPLLWLVPPLFFLVVADVHTRGMLAEGHSEALERFLTLSFRTTIFLQLLYVAVRTLSQSAGAFSRERERGTLEGLLASRLTLEEILRGKILGVLRPLAAELGLATALALVFLPPMGVVDVPTLLALQGFTAFFAVFFTLLGTWCSLRMRDTMRATQVACGEAAFLAVVSPVADLMLSVSGLHHGLGTSVCSPVMVLAALLWPSMLSGSAAGFLFLAAFFFAGAGAAMYRSSLGRLARLGADAPPPPARPKGWARRSGLAGLWDNPVWFRQVLLGSRQGTPRTRRLRRWAYPLVLLGPTLLVLLVTVLEGSRLDFHDVLVLGFFLSALGHAAYFPMVALSAGAGAVATERERKTLDPLLGTLSSGRDLVAGHLAVAAGLPLLEMAAWSPVLLAFSLVDGIALSVVLALEVFTAACVLLAATLGLWLGTRADSAQQAARQAYGVGALLVVATFVADFCLSQIDLLPGPFLFSLSNPLLALVSVLWPGSRTGHAWMWCSGIYLAASMALAWFAARRLGRAPRV